MVAYDDKHYTTCEQCSRLHIVKAYPVAYPTANVGTDDRASTKQSHNIARLRNRKMQLIDAINGHERHNHGAASVNEHYDTQIPIIARKAAVGVFINLDEGRHLLCADMQMCRFQM